MNCRATISIVRSSYVFSLGKLVMTRTVLVVEDEPLIRIGAIDLISDAGYAVLEATNADEAILLLESHPEIRVVFSDIEMPVSMDGLKLMHAVRERWPPVTLILASGRMVPHLSEMPTDTAFLRKPYRDEELLRLLGAIDWGEAVSA